MIETLLEWLYTANWLKVMIVLLILNILIIVSCIFIGNLLVRWYHNRPVAAGITSRPIEFVLALLTVFLNTSVSILGLYLWRNEVILLSTSFGWLDWLDIIVLLLIMDFAMYVFHRLAHLKILYPIIHRTHHRFEDPRPITLFALNPLENLGFGLLWIMVLTIYPASWIGISGYLFLNVAFGLMGHLGVEPFPNSWVKHPILKWISTSTYHTQHHQEEQHNFGFYTVIWDRVFGTISPHYPSHFARNLADRDRNI